jgi:hypothetical protein
MIIYNHHKISEIQKYRRSEFGVGIAAAWWAWIVVTICWLGFPLALPVWPKPTGGESE